MKNPFVPLLFTFSFFLFPFTLSAQDFGGLPPGVDWYQINTHKLRVIFPKGMEKQAVHLSSLIQSEDNNNRISIGKKSVKLDLLLNNQGVNSNGYVSTMPFRSEFFTTPPQDGSRIGTLDFMTTLGIHEYRHALQYMNLRRGIFGLAYYLTGDPGWGAFMTLTVPNWYFEGDAVATETALTLQGRGRIPSFMSQYPSILLDGRQYSYMKARNGSYKDYVPDWYTLGYLLCSYGRENYGNDVWMKVARRTSWMRGIIYPFSKALKANTGLSTRKFYKKAFKDYYEEWHLEDSLLQLTPSSPLTTLARVYTNYRYPVYLNDGTLIVHKSSFQKTGAIFKILPDSSEIRLCETGIAQDIYLSASGDWIAWAEVSWDPRFSSRSYSDIWLYNHSSGEKRCLTRGHRYFSPSVSPDAKQVLVCETDLANQFSIKILDINTGQELKILPNPDNLFFSYPKWDDGGEYVISTARKPSGQMLITRQHITSGKITELTKPINHILGEIVVTPKTLFYSSSYSGINNIYSLNRSTGSITQLTSTRFGAYHPAISPDLDSLVYSEFTRTGYRLVSAPVNRLLKKTVRPLPLDQLSKYDRAFFEAEGGNILTNIPETDAEIKPYRQWQHLFKVHSWSLNPTTESIGLFVMSDNILNNLHVEAGADYYWNEEVPGFSASVQYAGLYPVLGAGFSRNYRSVGGDEVPKRLFLDNTANLEASVPLNFSKGLYYRQALISTGLSLISYQEVRPSDLAAIDYATQLITLSANARYVQQKRQAYQNITTPLGFGLEFSMNQSVNSIQAFQYMAIADGAIRGLLPNHNLVMTGAWKYEPDNNDYSFMDVFIYPRGFSIPRSNWMVSVQSSYHFPLLYPDFGMAGIFYCSRVRGDLFFDYGYADIPADFAMQSNGLFLSGGVELIFDITWLNLAELPIGFRFSGLLTRDFDDPGKDFNFEFFIPVLRL